MPNPRLRFLSLLLPALALASAPVLSAAEYDVRSYGAVGDGRTIDTAAINRAIEDVAARGGGTVCFPAGTYASFSIHLRSGVSLHLEAGATLLAAQPPLDGSGGYDAPEPNPGLDQYQDFGHSHWHNSLIWGEDVHDISILGPGRIYGYGLSRGSNGRDQTPEERAAGIKAPHYPRPAGPSPKRGPFGYPGHDALPAGIGNKSIALKNCHDITIRDLTIYHGGHFAILATAADNLTLENLKIDTNRDGMDIDSCHNVHVSDCYVNSPFDDGICLKSDYSLGYVRPCENVTITNCHVSGYDEGTLLDGTFGRKYGHYGAGSGPTGRIKFGTEGSGGFRNVAISNCTFEYCRGLAIEEVDGGWLENVTITNLAMRDISNSAIYIRLGSRNRRPPGTPTGVLRRVIISNIVAENVDPRFSSIIAGIPGHDIEDLTLSNIRILYRGGGTAAWAAIEPPEKPGDYPEPSRYGIVPAYGFFMRHVRGLTLRDVDVRTLAPDARPPFVLEDVHDAFLDHVTAPSAAGGPAFVQRDVTGFEAVNSPGAGP